MRQGNGEDTRSLPPVLSCTTGTARRRGRKGFTHKSTALSLCLFSLCAITLAYPMDIRSSGKDLIPNHLTFAIYCHAAIFPEEKWPLSMRTNGHLMLNGKKMSKSLRNYPDPTIVIDSYGADAVR